MSNTKQDTNSKDRTHRKHAEYSKPMFDTSEEYNNVLYRQFTIQLGIMINPGLGWLAFVATTFEYFMSKYRLLYICSNRSKKTKATMTGQVFTFGCFNAVLALAAWPFGSAYLFSAGTVQGFSQCPVFK